MQFTRRDMARFALASAPLARALAAKKINSKFGGVQIGAITYSFNRIASPDAEAIIKAYVEIGLGEAELMSNHCESLAGAPPMPNFFRPGAPPRPPAGGPPAGGAPKGPGPRPQLTPEQIAERKAAQEKLVAWRTSTTPATWKGVAKKFNDAGIDLALLCYNMQDSMKDDDIEFGFQMAKALGVKGITTSTTLTMAKRIAPFADKHKLLVGYHGHDATNDPNQTATLESYQTLMGYGKYNGVNLDIGHFTAAGYDAVAFIKEHHAKITNLHIKDRKKDHGPNVAVWGTGDTPMKQVLQLLKAEKYPIPANLELEYPIPEGSDIIAEAKKCLAYVKSCLA
ncbi:sugar phosphate isomerase/epimerase family protein [Paludibaculum fermentans]|uniref:sugar phosphate isomerase/epimerase family protein n=1 Tax=Paludibaculum fermentans TaxID=1473598 RepID=UPI003EB8B4EC